MTLQLAVTIVVVLDCHPVPAMRLVDLGGEGAYMALVLGILLLFRSMLLMLGPKREKGLQVVVGMGDEVLYDLRFEEKLGIDFHDLIDLLFKHCHILGNG
jgi:hypothetical protein